MNGLNTLFSYYDKLISSLTPTQQAIISLLLLILLIWQIYMIIKSGHWIFILAFVVLLPGTWPAAKQIGGYIWSLIKFLFVRAQILIS